MSVWFSAIRNKWAWRWFVLLILNYPVFLLLIRLFYPDNQSAEDGLYYWSWRWLFVFPSDVFSPGDPDRGVQWAFLLFLIVLGIEIFYLDEWLLPN